MRKFAIFFCIFLDENKHISFDYLKEYRSGGSEDLITEDFYKWVQDKKKEVSSKAVLISLRII
jgi:hypothetical protein